ncbi:MAG TPA: VWA domain-containing protein [Planctomycetes bacterium]|nr:VWA domain-containing protein [Planctomycetota bacterium]HIN80335.1 VWA domain-containing protein [Planctomycetota bacterium]
MNFANPLLLGFLYLAVIPLVIYLINRQRYHRRQWAAMEFLLRALRKHRRRLRLENLLLLLLRTALVLLFVLALARPTVDSGQLPLLGSTGRQEAILIDASYSMGVRQTSRSVLSDARDLGRGILRSLQRGDRTGLLVGGLPPGEGPNLGDDAELVGESGAVRTRAALGEFPLGTLPLDLAPLLSEAAAFVEHQGGPGWQLHLISDLQRRDWLSAEATAIPAVREAFERIEALEAEVVLHPVGPERPRNVTIVSLDCTTPLLTSDLPTSFQVTVLNQGRDAVAGLEVEVWIDEELQGSRRIDVDEGDSAVVSFPHVFREAGLARVRAKVRSDDLELDDQRHIVLDVRQSVEVLVIDGGYDAVEEAAESDWLKAALGSDDLIATGVRLTPFHLQILPPDRFLSADLENVQVLVLANVASMSAADSEKIEGFLENGGGVLAFCGSRVQPLAWSRNAWRSGEGWFPYSPGGEIFDARRQAFFHWQIENADHPVMKFLAETPDAGIGDVAVHGYRLLASEVDPEAVLMTLDDFDKTPALVEKQFGKGTVLAFNIGAGRSWSNFPISPAFVCFLFEAMPYLAARSGESRQLALGEPYNRVIDSDEYAPRVLVVTPDGSSVPLALIEREDRRSFDLHVDGRWEPGLFEIRFDRGANSSDAFSSDWFAVNVDPREGELIRAPEDLLVDLYPALSLAEHSTQIEEATLGGSGDLWYPIFWVVLFLLVSESLLARSFGRSRRRKS